MSDMPPSSSGVPTPGAQPPSGGSAKLIGAVVLAGAVAAATFALVRPKTPEAPPAVAQKPVAPPAPTPPPAAPRLSESLSDLEVSTALGVMKLAGVKTLNASLPKADVEAILRGDMTKLAAFDAEAVTMERVEWRQMIGGAPSTATYEDVAARAIKGGVVGVLSAARGGNRAEATDKRKAAETKFETISIERFDVPLAVRWLTEADPDGKAALARLHGPYSIKSMVMLIEDARVEMGEMVLNQTLVRPARRPVRAIFDDIQAMAKDNGAEKPAPAPGNGAAPAPEAKAETKKDETALLLGVIDLLASFELGQGTINGLRGFSVNPKPEDAASVDVRKVLFSGGAGARFGLEGLAVKTADGQLGLKGISMGGDVLSFMMMAADKALRARESDAKPGDEALRAQIKARVSTKPLPDVTFALEGLNGDFPADKKAPTGARITFDLKRASFLMGNFVALTPTRIDYGIEGLDIPLPQNKEPGVVALRAMGIERLALTSRLAAIWEAAGERVTLQDLHVDVGQLARLGINAEMANVPRAFFEDPERNWPSAMGATINALVIEINNNGGLAKLVDVLAREQKKTGEQMRNEFAALAPMLIGGMLNAHPDGSKLSQAVSAFIKNLNGMKLKVTAAGPNGIALTDFAVAGQNPVEFANKLRFEAEGK